jgi:hypothetical protein
MIPLTQALAVLHLSPEQLRQETRAGRLVTYRLLIKNRWRWYVQRPVEAVNPQT